jgi:ParB-like chromosome segregation protein Spo0J
MTTTPTPTPQSPEPKPLTVHAYADLFPRMGDEEFKALVEDIRANGLRQPIVIYQGQILDGRHRYDAAKQLGRMLTDNDFTEFKPVGPDNALKFVVSQNVHRRHLNESQRALIAAQIANLQKGANQHTMAGGSIDLPSAAKMLNVGEASVKRARNVLDKAAPQIVEQIKQGKTRVSAVSKEVLKKPKDQQVKALAEEKEKKEREKNQETKAPEEYDKAEEKLIEKLKAFAPDTAEAAVAGTIKKLKETLATMKSAVEAATKKAA